MKLTTNLNNALTRLNRCATLTEKVDGVKYLEAKSLNLPTKQLKVSEHLMGAGADAAVVGGDTVVVVAAADVVGVAQASVQTVFLKEVSLNLFPRVKDQAKEQWEAFLGWETGVALGWAVFASP